MLKELLKNECPNFLEDLLSKNEYTNLSDFELCDLFIEIYKFKSNINQNDIKNLVRIGEGYHYKRNLMESGKYYKKALDICPPVQLSTQEIGAIYKYMPVLKIQSTEFFDLKDVVVIHHPTLPLICYHLFWEDDYDFPDDYDPCDHEQIWIGYDEKSALVTGVWTFFHSKIVFSENAVKEANENDFKAIINVEWGKHGSMPMGYEKEIFDEINNITVEDQLYLDYTSCIEGGRQKNHPLKKHWPKGFMGTFEQYCTFETEINITSFLDDKESFIKAEFANPVIQQYFLHYNFCPKFDWPFNLKKIKNI